MKAKLTAALSHGLKVLIKKYPDFDIKVNGEVAICSGPLLIKDRTGKRLGYFEVMLISTSKYPFEFPVLREVSNKIPQTADRHNPAGICCVCIRQIELIRSQKGITLVEFLEEFAIPFFANQLYFEIKGIWINGDWKHGENGVLQFYEELFGVADHEVIKMEMLFFLKLGMMPRNILCPCGSGRKFKKCHLLIFETLTAIGSDEVRKNLIQFQKLVRAV